MTREKKRNRAKAENPGPYVCHICNKEVADPGKLKVHLRTHGEGIQEKTMECPQCSKKFSSKKYLDAHLQRHKQNDKIARGEIVQLNQSLRCPLCPKMFAVKKYLDAHIKRHEDSKRLNKSVELVEAHNDPINIEPLKPPAHFTHPQEQHNVPAPGMPMSGFASYFPYSGQMSYT